MLEEATDENIINIITKPDATNEQKIKILRGATNENKDNHTAHLIYIDKVEGTAVPPAAKETEQTGPKGTFITPDVETPEFEEPKEALAGKAPVADIKQQPAGATSQTGFSAASRPKKKHNPLPLIAGAVVIATIAVAATFFMKTGKGNEAAAGQNTTKTTQQAQNPKVVKHQPKKRQGRKTPEAKVVEKKSAEANHEPNKGKEEKFSAAKFKELATKQPAEKSTSAKPTKSEPQGASATNTTQQNPDQTK